MTRPLLALLALLAASPALANAPVLLTDPNNAPIGVAANPLYTAPANPGPATVNQGSPNGGGSAGWYVQWAGQSVAVSNTVAITAASLPLPAGASTSAAQAAVQSAPGTSAGTAEGVQGVNGGVPLAVDLSRSGAGGLLGSVQGGYSDGTTLTTVGVGFASVRVDRRGQYRISETGSDDPLVGIAPVVVQSGTSAVGKGSGGNLYGVYALNSTTTAAFVAVVNATAAPASGATITPQECRPLPASGSVDFGYGSGPPDSYSTGIVVLVSTSCSTYTPGGASFLKVRVR